MQRLEFSYSHVKFAGIFRFGVDHQPTAADLFA